MKRPFKRRESENKSAYSDMAHAKSKTKALKKKKASGDNNLFESVERTIKRIKDNPFDSRYDD